MPGILGCLHLLRPSLGHTASGRIVRERRAVDLEISRSIRNYGIQERLGLPSGIGILTFALLYDRGGGHIQVGN